MECYQPSGGDTIKTFAHASPACGSTVLLMCHFFALQGEKMTHKEFNIIGKRKS
jgi:hypothetical protein